MKVIVIHSSDTDGRAILGRYAKLNNLGQNINIYRNMLFKFCYIDSKLHRKVSMKM